MVSSTDLIFAREAVSWRNHRQAEHFLEQAHRRHRALHGSGVRFDEVHLQQLDDARVDLPRRLEIVGRGQIDHARHV